MFLHIFEKRMKDNLPVNFSRLLWPFETSVVRDQKKKRVVSSRGSPEGLSHASEGAVAKSKQDGCLRVVSDISVYYSSFC